MTAPTPADSHEIRALTGIRGFAALLVVTFHFYSSWVVLVPTLSFADVPIQQGGIGVDLFFILSGFILSYVYEAGGKQLSFAAYRKFIWFRLARIYPNHLATLGVMLVLVTLAQFTSISLNGSYPLQDLPFQLTMTQTWPLAPYNTRSVWNFPAWSISTEWFAYLAIFPLVTLITGRIRRSAAAMFVGFAVLLSWVILTILHPAAIEDALLRVSCEFVAGSMFFRVFSLHSSVVIFCQRRASSLFLALLVLLCFRFPIGSFGTLGVFSFLLLGLTSEESLIGRLLSMPVALWLGRVSYSLYMSHAIALKLLKIILPAARFATESAITRVLVLTINFIIILAMASALYYLVEVPSRNLLRRVRVP